MCDLKKKAATTKNKEAREQEKMTDIDIGSKQEDGQDEEVTLTVAANEAEVYDTEEKDYETGSPYVWVYG